MSTLSLLHVIQKIYVTNYWLAGISKTLFPRRPISPFRQAQLGWRGMQFSRSGELLRRTQQLSLKVGWSFCVSDEGRVDFQYQLETLRLSFLTTVMQHVLPMAWRFWFS